MALHRHAVGVGQRGRRTPEHRQARPARDVDEVGRDRRGGGVAARARANEGQFADRVAVDRDGVQDAHRLGERRALLDHGRMDALLDAVGRALGDAEQLDAEAEFVGRGEIGERDRFDPLDRDGRSVDLRAEGERGEDGELMRGVEAADVEGRVGLGVAEPLRLGEADVERQVLRLHPRQNVVAGAVENARDALDRIAGEALAQRLDHRNAAADRRLEEERRAVGLGQRGEFQPVRGDHRLVGGDDRQAAPERRLDRLERDPVGAADQFDEDVDVAVRRQLDRVVVEAGGADLGQALARRRAL